MEVISDQFLRVSAGIPDLWYQEPRKLLVLKEVPKFLHLLWMLFVFSNYFIKIKRNICLNSSLHIYILMG